MNIKIFLLILFVSLNTLFATTVSTIMKESNDKFCKNTLLNDNSQKEVNFCMESKRTYPKVSSSNKILENHIRQAIHS